MSSDDELQMYQAQISAIDEQLKTCNPGSQKDELEETKRDLLELVSLLQEESVEQIGEGTSAESSSTNDDSDIDYDEYIGLRVSAAPHRFRLPISHHSAIVLEVLPATNIDGLMAKVLFSAPLLSAMKPCPHFLSGTCKFNEKCRFSHGEKVYMKDFEEYKEPDYSQLQDGSLVLVSVDSGLWDVGRVKCHDHKEYAIKLLKSGKEMAATIDKIIPLDSDVEVQEDEEKIVIPNDSWSELKKETCGTVKVGELGNWTGGGLGLKLMQKMGYKLGEGLGKNSDGIVHAVQAVVYKKNKGLDSKDELANVESTKKPKKRLARAMEQKNIGFDCDIFHFLNRKLETRQPEDAAQILKREKKDMDKCSERDLGIRGLDLESEIKELRTKEKKLREGIRRNQNDNRTVSKLESNIQLVQKQISALQGRHSRLHRELKDRKERKRDIF